MVTTYNEIDFRIATVSDARSVAEINVIASKAVYANILAREFLDGLSVEKRLPVFEKRIQDPQVFCLVAVQNQKVVGFADLGPIRDSQSNADGELYAIYLLPEVQRRGIGHRLFEMGFQEMRSRQFKKLLATVFTENRAACQFYEALKGRQGLHSSLEVSGQNYKTVSYLWNF